MKKNRRKAGTIVSFLLATNQRNKERKFGQLQFYFVLRGDCVYMCVLQYMEVKLVWGEAIAEKAGAQNKQQERLRTQVSFVVDGTQEQTRESWGLVLQNLPTTNNDETSTVKNVE